MATTLLADGAADQPPAHQPYIAPADSPPEFTWPAVLVGAVLGIVFGASSLYLLLKVGMTVSASVPIAVLSITLFRALSRAPLASTPNRRHAGGGRDAHPAHGGT